MDFLRLGGAISSTIVLLGAELKLLKEAEMTEGLYSVSNSDSTQTDSEDFCTLNAFEKHMFGTYASQELQSCSAISRMKKGTNRALVM